MWKILDTGQRSAQENMEIDQKLLKEMKPEDPPLLHFYEWKGEAATYGYFTDPSRFLSLEGVKARALSLARRPTGGGIIFHLSDFAFSVCIPSRFPFFSTKTLENYRFIHDAVRRAVEPLLPHSLSLLQEDPLPSDPASSHFCMAKPTI